MSAAGKTERLMKLLIMLLVQRTYVSKAKIREILYPGSSDDAFERMFDRDKETLRSIGVPIDVGTIDNYFDDEHGYRVLPDVFALPEIDLTAEEAAVVGLATRVWEHQRLAEATNEAVLKLTASGADIDVEALDIAQPRLAADEPSFDVFLDAAYERYTVAFAYRTAHSATTARRRLQPWGVTRYSGRWYVVGYDLDRQDERVFRLSRVQGDAVRASDPGTHTIPPDVDIAAITRRLVPAPATEEAVLLVRRGTAAPLRLAADQIETDVPPPPGGADDGWDRLVVRHLVGLEDEVMSHGANVVVVSPADLRDRVVARFEAVAAR